MYSYLCTLRSPFFKKEKCSRNIDIKSWNVLQIDLASKLKLPGRKLAQEGFLILCKNGWGTENIKILLDLHDPQNTDDLWRVSEEGRMNILSFSSWSFKLHCLLGPSRSPEHSFAKCNRVELIFILDRVWAAQSLAWEMLSFVWFGDAWSHPSRVLFIARELGKARPAFSSGWRQSPLSLIPVRYRRLEMEERVCTVGRSQGKG